MRRLSIQRGLAAVVLGAAIANACTLALADAPRDKEGFAPDPPQRASTKQWLFEVAVTRGTPAIVRARPVTFEHAAETARVIGRFAVELYVGPELLDRIRFDVPLMGSGPTPKSPRHPFPRPGFEDVTTRMEVRMADNPRAVFVLVVDRQTKKTQRFQWPPEADGHLVPWTVPVYQGADAWPPPGAVPDASRDAGSRG